LWPIDGTDGLDGDSSFVFLERKAIRKRKNNMQMAVNAVRAVKPASRQSADVTLRQIQE